LLKKATLEEAAAVLATLKEKADALKSSGNVAEADQIYGLVQAMSQMKVSTRTARALGRSASVDGGSVGHFSLKSCFAGQSPRQQKNQGGGHSKLASAGDTLHALLHCPHFSTSMATACEIVSIY